MREGNSLRVVVLKKEDVLMSSRLSCRLLSLCHCCRRLHDGVHRRGWEDVAVLCGLGRWLLGPRKRIYRQGVFDTRT